MTVTPSKSREQAESAFDRTQSQFLARNRIISEQDALVQAREEKTQRLRELRLAKEASDLANAKPAATTKRAGKR